MKSIVVLGVVLVFLFAASTFGLPMTEIWYDTTDLGAGRWEYTYDVCNISLTEGIEEFTIWFDYGSYDNLVITTPETPPEWDQIVWDVEPVLEDPGGYDAFATNLNIDIGESLSGFSVSFDWLGIGDPGSQPYDIIDPTDYSTSESGTTQLIPEPITLLFLGFGSLVLWKKKQ